MAEKATQYDEDEEIYGTEGEAAEGYYYDDDLWSDAQHPGDAEEVGKNQKGKRPKRVHRKTRPQHNPIFRGQGLRVQLRRIPGVTKKGILTVPFSFQCPPIETFSNETVMSANDYQTIQNGYYTRMIGPELTTITFDTLWTIAPYAFVINRHQWSPSLAQKRLRKILRSETAFRLVAWHPGPKTELKMMVTMRSLGSEERSGENDAKYFNVSFTQWRDPVLRRRKKRKFPIKHKLAKGDTLARLARKYYGDASKANQIKVYTPALRHWGNNTPIWKSKHYTYTHDKKHKNAKRVVIIRAPLNSRDEFHGHKPNKHGQEHR